MHAGPDVSKPKECLPLNLLSHSMSVEELGFVFSSRKRPDPPPPPSGILSDSRVLKCLRMPETGGLMWRVVCLCRLPREYQGPDGL